MVLFALALWIETRAVGIMIEARTPIMKTTISSSMSLKPFDVLGKHTPFPISYLPSHPFEFKDNLVFKKKQIILLEIMGIVLIN